MFFLIICIKYNNIIRTITFIKCNFFDNKVSLQYKYNNYQYTILFYHLFSKKRDIARVFIVLHQPVIHIIITCLVQRAMQLAADGSAVYCI